MTPDLRIQRIVCCNRMLFNSPVFLFIFLPLTLGLFFATRLLGKPKATMLVLVLCSLVFYGWWNPAYLTLLVASIAINYGFGLHTARSSGSSRRISVISAVVVNLMLLCWFKYAGFLVESLEALIWFDLPEVSIMLPLAISFFTFQQIAWQIDIYRHQVMPDGLLKYSLFVSFFPQLIAGPIVHHKEMMPQLHGNFGGSRVLENFQVGLFIFTLGLFKKVVFADGAAQYATPVFDRALQGEEIDFLRAWIGALCYSTQLYFDFSGYSDMAIGIARMFGVRLPLNFFSPYKSRSIVDFWRRWHMTLSRFLRDYLYIPLGGNRHGVSRWGLSIMITMLLGGLWHGASWTFVAWGGLHGLYLLTAQGWARYRETVYGNRKNPLSSLGKLSSWMLTLLVVVVGWVIFRAESFPAAWEILRGMAGLNGIVVHPSVLEFIGLSLSDLRTLVPRVSTEGMHGREFYPGIIYGVGLLLICVLSPNVYQLTRYYSPTVDYPKFEEVALKTLIRWFPTPLWGAILGFTGAVALLKVFSAAPSEFLYFQF